MKSFTPHIVVIRDAIAHIQRYQPVDKATFPAEPMVQDAILMRLQVIGENLANMRDIDDEKFAALGDATWNQVIGLRNIISHGYVTIGFERMWDFLVEDLPQLAESIDSAERQLE